MLVLGAQDVRDALAGQEDEVVRVVADAYRAHAERRTTVPHSTFLHLPDGNRIIALPARVEDTDSTRVGMKWIASFPGNLERNLPRASAVIVLNSAETGRPEALLEAATISAWRTAAGAALAASWLSRDARITGVSLVGCGVINQTVLRFLLATQPELRSVRLHDTNPEAAPAFAKQCSRKWPTIATNVVSLAGALAGEHLISFATTAGQPHTDLSACRPGSLVLHLSLRDIAPAAIVASRNIVDDPDHVCRAETSLHLAELGRGDRGFIDRSIGEVLADGPLPRDPARPTVFSPFGLGVLDIAVAALVLERATARGLGTSVPRFLD